MKKKILTGLLVTGLTLGNAVTVLAAPVTMPDGTIFDAVYYAQTYPDVAAAFGTDADALYNHYITYGKAEGRLPAATVQANTSSDSIIFDATFYARTYPDVAAAFGTDADALYNHYITYGKAEGRLPISPGINEAPGKSIIPGKATVLNNTIATGTNPYAGKTVSVPASSIATDGLTYPDNFPMALGNGTVLQYDGSGRIGGGYVTATVVQNDLVVRYDLLTSTNGTEFHRLPSDSEYLFFIRDAATGEIAGIFRNSNSTGFSFPENGGSQSFNINTASQVWVHSKDNNLIPNGILPNGSYFVTVGTASTNTPTASNIFTINRNQQGTCQHC